MTEQQIIDMARAVVNGDTVVVKYRKPADVLNKRNHAKKHLIADLEVKHGRKGTKAFEAVWKEAKKTLPKMKEGGADPSIKLFKQSQFTWVYDQRDYFAQCLQEQHQNLYPTEEESLYKKIRGILYERRSDGKLFLRWAIREDRLDSQVSYSSDKAGNSVKSYEEIEDYLQEAAKAGYKSYNRQTDHVTSTGRKPDVKIVQMTLAIDRVKSVKVSK